ncbi:MAG: isoprenylcysteine carboxylmethyltransferase family protein [Bacteroidia bacterium]
MDNLFYTTYFVWILSEIVLNRFVRSKSSDKQNTDKKTELFLWLTIALCTTIGTLTAMNLYCPILLNYHLSYIGLGIIMVGIIIRFTAIKQLGKFFTVDVTIRENHQLMQSGFYKWLRHPSYTGCLLSFFGYGIALNNWLSLALIFVPILITFVLRMNVEEKVLTQQFGNQYQDYIAKTKRLIPFLY